MNDAELPTCAGCGRSFPWEECYLSRSTPGLDPPAGIGEWGARTYCPSCGAIVTELVFSDWQGNESWEWQGRNATVNVGRALPPPPIVGGWGQDVPRRLVPLHEETTLDVAAVERLAPEIEAELQRTIPDAARAVEEEAKRLAGAGEPIAAATKIEQALELGLAKPAAARALGELGVDLVVERDDLEEGIALCRRSVEIWPEACWQAHCVVALFYNANGDADAGRKAYGDARRYAATRWWEPRYEARLVDKSRTWAGRVPRPPGRPVEAPGPEPELAAPPAETAAQAAAQTAVPPRQTPERAAESSAAEAAAGAGPEEQAASPSERSIRVFVSSTFLDMQEERDDLVKRVFPRLREICEQRAVTWSEVDLRWGITDERQGEVLPICLTEVRACRPYFIGLIGERYGWVPDEIPQELVDEHPWLEQHPESSVTELEVLYGVLDDPEMAEHAFFYLRDPGYLASIADDARPLYEEVASSEEVARFGAEEAQARAARRRDKLARFKDRIRASGLPVRAYPQPRALGELVLEDLEKVIDRVFPEGSEPSSLASEAVAHERLAERLRRAYIERPEYLQRLTDHAADSGPPLVVSGDAGIGKSALLAAWVERHRRARLDDLVLTHFVGASPQSADWRTLVRRLLAELNSHLGLGLDYPGDPEALRTRFADGLFQAGARGRLVLVLDGLDQLDERDQGRELAWLPSDLPANVRLVVSAGPGDVLDRLGERSWPRLTVAPLTPDERSQLIAAYLSQYAKALEPMRAATIAAAPQTASPLYLRTVLEELRQFGVRERLDERIAWYLEADDLAGVFARVLSRYEQDFERDRPGLVADAMCLLWAARRGLAEAELRDLLGERGAPLPQAVWSPLHLAAGEFLVTRSGLISLADEQFKRAVERRYLGDGEKAAAAHLRLADYFETREDGERRREELPWQLAQARAWDRLSRLVSDPAMLASLWRADEFETQAYWAQIERDSDFRMVEAYQPVLQAPEDYGGDVWQVAMLLHEAGHVTEALALNEFLAERSRAAGDMTGAAAALGNAALCRAALGDLEKALDLFREQERLCRELNDGSGLVRSLHNRAAALTERGEYGEAIALYETVERLSRERADQATLVVALGNHGNALRNMGDYEAALALYGEQERLATELGDRKQASAALDGRGAIEIYHGEPRRALELFEREERMLRELGNRLSLPNCLGNQGLAHLALGDHGRAMELLREMERLCREMSDRRGVADALGRQGGVSLQLREFDTAMRCFEEQERVCRELGLKHELEACLGNKAIILRARGDLAGAMALHQEKERICREIGDRRGLAIALGNQGNVKAAMGDAHGAMALYKQKEAIDRELGNVEGLAHGLFNQTGILLQWGMVDEAERVLDEQERLVRQVGHPEKVARSLMLRAEILIKHRNQPSRAQAIVEEAYGCAVASGQQQFAQDVKRVLDILRSSR